MSARLEQAQSMGSNSRLERSVATVLRAGVVVSSLVTATGIAVTLTVPATLRSARAALPELRRGALRPSASHAPHSVAGVLQGLGHRSGPAIVMFGLLLLIATPVLRVGVSVVGFAAVHDRRFVVITLSVLAVLVGSFAVGI